MTILEQSEILALEFTKLPSLPPLVTEKDQWNSGIALVEKIDGTSNYAVVKNVDGDVSIVKDFGAPAAIKAIVELYAITSNKKNGRSRKN